MYCYVCCETGHAVTECPDVIACALREGRQTKGLKNRELCLQDTPESIVEALQSLNSPFTEDVKENKLLLRNAAAAQRPPLMIVYTN